MCFIDNIFISLQVHRTHMFQSSSFAAADLVLALAIASSVMLNFYEWDFIMNKNVLMHLLVRIRFVWFPFHLQRQKIVIQFCFFFHFFCQSHVKRKMFACLCVCGHFFYNDNRMNKCSLVCRSSYTKPTENGKQMTKFTHYCKSVIICLIYRQFYTLFYVHCTHRVCVCARACVYSHLRVYY